MGNRQMYLGLPNSISNHTRCFTDARGSDYHAPGAIAGYPPGKLPPIREPGGAEGLGERSPLASPSSTSPVGGGSSRPGGSVPVPRLAAVRLGGQACFEV